ncbi:MAG: glucose 1-dehydrogenase [Pseudomonadota bacterium]
MTEDLSEQVALVTGAARGIGRAIAHQIAKQGADVAVADLRADQLKETVSLVEQTGRRAIALTVDVTKLPDVERMIEETVRQLGRLDILFNNAGVIKIHDPLSVTEADWDQVMDVNAKAVFFCAQAAGRHMLENSGGKIINTASIAARVGTPDSVAYGASKAAVMSITRSLGLAWARKGVAVNAIAPGMVDTDMWAQIDEETAEMRGLKRGEPKARRIRHITNGRAATPENVAAMAGFLASPAADHITAQTFNVDGGDVPS